MDYFSELDTSVLVHILSQLRPLELAICACVCKRFNELHKDDLQLWLPTCEARWGFKTNPKSWITGVAVNSSAHVSDQPILTFRDLYRFFEEWESLIGFWRFVGNAGLIKFLWRSNHIEGRIILPEGKNSFDIKTASFLQSGVTEHGRVVSFLMEDTQLQQNMESKFQQRSPIVPVSSNQATLAFPLNLKDSGAVEVQITLQGGNLLCIEETCSHFPNSPNQVDSFNFRFTETSQQERLSSSPSNYLPYELYSTLASKVPGSPGDKLSSRNRRKYKSRIRGTSPGFESKHLVKIPISEIEPTNERPLQGLWKGILPSGNLDIVLIQYLENEIVSCRRVGILEESQRIDLMPMKWVSQREAKMTAPFSNSEMVKFTQKHHIEPKLSPQKSIFRSSEDSDVFSFLKSPSCEDFTQKLENCSLISAVSQPSLWDSSEVKEVHLAFVEGHLEGRLWYYENGNFGYGTETSDFVVDYCRMTVEE